MSENGPNWKKHEKDLQEWLGLSSTSGSGNKWYDISDGTTRGHYSADPFPLMIDCKATLKGSYSVNKKFMREWEQKAALEGKNFMLPIRFEEENGKFRDYVVVPMNTFLEMWEIMHNYLDLANS